MGAGSRLSLLSWGGGRRQKHFRHFHHLPSGVVDVRSPRVELHRPIFHKAAALVPRYEFTPVAGYLLECGVLGFKLADAAAFTL
jgi:hypothetical protein